jgi:hypothetical protein
MGVQQVSINTAFAFQPGAGNIGAAGEDFAELVRQDEVTAALNTRDRQRMIERERIAEIGFVQFQREQYEIRKMLRLMTEFAEKAPRDVQRKFDEIVADLEQYPPHYPQEMYARIEAAIACIPESAPDNLRQRMKEAYALLKQEMAKPDPELERLKRAEEQRRRQAFYRPEALATAAFL